MSFAHSNSGTVCYNTVLPNNNLVPDLKGTTNFCTKSQKTAPLNV